MRWMRGDSRRRFEHAAEDGRLSALRGRIPPPATLYVGIPDRDCVAVSGTKLGDVDGDGVTNIGDTTTLIDMLLSDGNSDRQVSNEAADIDGDGKLTIKDVTSLVDLLLKSN